MSGFSRWCVRAGPGAASQCLKQAGNVVGIGFGGGRPAEVTECLRRNRPDGDGGDGGEREWEAGLAGGFGQVLDS